MTARAPDPWASARRDMAMFFSYIDGAETALRGSAFIGLTGGPSADFNMALFGEDPDDLAVFDDFVSRVNATGLSAFAMDRAWVDRTFAAPSLLDAPALGFYVAYRGDVPMSGVCTSGAGSTVGIWTMSTPPEKQRQGAGRAVLVAAMQDHLRRGAETFYLIATPAGKPLYDSLGFKVVDELSIWLVGESTQFPAH